MAKTLAEIAASSTEAAKRFSMARAIAWELCSECPLKECSTDAKTCRCRLFKNERHRQNNLKNPKQQARCRVANMTPEQHARRLMHMRNYRADSMVSLKIKRLERRAAAKKQTAEETA